MIKEGTREGKQRVTKGAEQERHTREKRNMQKGRKLNPRKRRKR